MNDEADIGESAASQNIDADLTSAISYYRSMPNAGGIAGLLSRAVDAYRDMKSLALSQIKYSREVGRERNKAEYERNVLLLKEAATGQVEGPAIGSEFDIDEQLIGNATYLRAMNQPYSADMCDRAAAEIRRLRKHRDQLLNVLRRTVEEYGQPGGPWNVPSEPGSWLEMARSAIAKAGGET